MQVSICRHIKTNGLQCHGAQLTGSSFCYFHNRLHRSHDLYRDKVHFQSAQMAHPRFLQLPDIEDRESAQLAISCVINALATGCIDTKHANSLFYGLQLASANARGLRIVRRPTQLVRDVYKEPWVTIPDANPDIAPPGRTCEVDDPAAPVEEAPAPLEEQPSEPPAQRPTEEWAAEPVLSLSAAASDPTPQPVAPHSAPARPQAPFRPPRICSRTRATLQSTKPAARIHPQPPTRKNK
jgi:hypothetical protein